VNQHAATLKQANSCSSNTLVAHAQRGTPLRLRMRCRLFQKACKKKDKMTHDQLTKTAPHVRVGWTTTARYSLAEIGIQGQGMEVGIVSLRLAVVPPNLHLDIHPTLTPVAINCQLQRGRSRLRVRQQQPRKRRHAVPLPPLVNQQLQPQKSSQSREANAPPSPLLELELWAARVHAV
jgi:hypothetical protein